MIGVILFFAIWLCAWFLNIWLTNSATISSRFKSVAVPAIFGTTVMILWELGVQITQISAVILPAPSLVFTTLFSSLDTLWIDFVQTVIKGALRGFFIGAIAAFSIAIVIDRSPFLTKGMLPIGNFFAALPIVGVAPIMVNWFGFDWQSKAAVVVIMVFFPILVNTVQGLHASNAMQRDLMKTYASSYFDTLFKLRLPSAMPHIFNGLKIATTLSLIGAIVAEYFGSPTRGMGFRISTGVGSLSIDLVWAEIFVAAIVGSLFFGLMTWIEARITFWHPSQRK
ncbi:MAG: ABC transporter permease [Flavobacteriaceae bacterium]|jgi:NitT/TauT family transport system permease protein|nr:ABC transporter permease [Flavobacteriaceae bacterium]